MAAKTIADSKNGEKISVKVKKKTPAENPEAKKTQDTTEEVEQSQVSKQAPTLQPSREYLDKQTRDEQEDHGSKSEDDTPQDDSASSLSTMEHSASKLTPSKKATKESHDEEEKIKEEGVDEVDEYGQKTLTVADYAQQPPQGIASEDQRDYKLSKSRLKRPPKGHHRLPAALLSALLLLVLCAIVAAGVYFLSQHSL